MNRYVYHDEYKFGINAFWAIDVLGYIDQTQVPGRPDPIYVSGCLNPIQGNVSMQL